MKAKKLTSITALDEQVRRLYESAFPVEEQIPYEDLMTLMDKMHWILQAITKVMNSLALPSSIRERHSIGFGILPCAMNCGERAWGKRFFPC